MTMTNTINAALNQDATVPTLEGAAQDIVQSLDPEDLEMRHTDLPHVPVVVMLHASLRSMVVPDGVNPAGMRFATPKDPAEVPADINPALQRFARAIRALRPQTCAPEISLLVSETWDTVNVSAAGCEDFALSGDLELSGARSLVGVAQAARTDLQMRRLMSAIYGVRLATPIVFLLMDASVSDGEALATFREERLAESFQLVTLPLRDLDASLRRVAETVARICVHDPSQPLDLVLG